MNMHQRVQEQAPAYDFFMGIGLAVDQMQDDVSNDLPKLMLRVASAQRAKDPVALKLACEAFTKHLTGMIGVSDLVARLSLNHANRRPRP